MNIDTQTFHVVYFSLLGVITFVATIGLAIDLVAVKVAGKRLRLTVTVLLIVCLLATATLFALAAGIGAA